MTAAAQPASMVKEQFILRFPNGMRARLKEIAASNRRSLNAQLLLMIERGLVAAEEQESDAQAAIQPSGDALTKVNGTNMA